MTSAFVYRATTTTTTVCGYLVVVLALAMQLIEIPKSPPAMVSATPAVSFTGNRNGNQVIRFAPQTRNDVLVLAVFMDCYHMDVWRAPKKLGGFYDVMVNPTQRDLLVRFLRILNIRAEILIPNLQTQTLENFSSFTLEEPQFNWYKFHRYGTITAWLKSQASQHASIATLMTIGKSSEGRPIMGLQVAHGKNLPVVIVEGGIHSREWISPSTAMWLANEAIRGANSVVRSYEWHILPVVNPDGYEYSFAPQNRFWRKNRRYIKTACTGVDINRNFPYRWRRSPAWDNCSESFAGMFPESEPETRALLTHLRSNAPRTKVYLSFHSYGQSLTYPWAFTPFPTRHNNSLQEIALKAVQKLSARYGTQYRVGQIASTIYRVFGSSVDFAYSLNIPYSFAFELRDTGTKAFNLPKSEIIPTAEETFDAVVVILEEVLRRVVGFGK